MTLKVNIRYYFGQYNIGQSFFIKSLKVTRFHNVQHNTKKQVVSGIDSTQQKSSLYCLIHMSDHNLVAVIWFINCNYRVLIFVYLCVSVCLAVCLPVYTITRKVMGQSTSVRQQVMTFFKVD